MYIFDAARPPATLHFSEMYFTKEISCNIATLLRVLYRFQMVPLLKVKWFIS